MPVSFWLARVTVVLAVSVLSATSADAGPGKGSKASPKVTSPAKAQGPKVASPATASAKPAKATKPAKPTKPATGGPKSTTAGTSKAATKAAKANGSKHTLAAATTSTSATSTSTTATSTTASNTSGAGTTTGTPSTGTVWVPDNPVAKKLATKANLLSKVQTSLPGADLNAATAGFKNFGQFVAAVNTSQNLGIPFADLKASMTGLTMAGEPTGQPTLSLGQSIQQLKPGTDATLEAQTAQTQANAEIASSPTTATTSKKSWKKPAAVATSASR